MNSVIDLTVPSVCGLKFSVFTFYGADVLLSCFDLGAGTMKGVLSTIEKYEHDHDKLRDEICAYLTVCGYDDLEYQIGLRKYSVVGSYAPLFPISIQSAIDELQL